MNIKILVVRTSKTILTPKWCSALGLASFVPVQPLTQGMALLFSIYRLLWVHALKILTPNSPTTPRMRTKI